MPRRRKLQLSRETLRVLSSADLATVAGVMQTGSCRQTCADSCPFTACQLNCFRITYAWSDCYSIPCRTTTITWTMP